MEKGEIEAALLERVRAAYAPGASAEDVLALDDAKRSWDADRVIARLSDPRWEMRVLAIEVLRVGASPATERACLFVGRMQDEDDPRVREAIVAAFVDVKDEIGDALTAAFVTRFEDDEEAAVRHAVAGTLGGNRSEQAIAVLVRLTRDADAGVRDWACFGLGHMLGSGEDAIDTDEIRDALAACLDDENDDVREEAATGLALRGDARGLDAVTVLLARFDEDGVSDRVLGTAEEAPDARWVPALEAIVVARPDLQRAVRALDACRAKRPRAFCGVPRHAGCDCFRVGVR